ncbi:SDR family oxidoreductase [Deferrisoma camini]|uniref:SDR family oxidoreductase n=1 Tax=Deferrisoma camini TaxID=1035120 RepID=UPI00046CBD0E|nr:SDR family oxidoreductase [Deferrisoma camini]
MATFLVTGVAGFIGSNLAEALLAQGHRVRGLDNFLTGKPENLRGLDGLEFVEGDVRDPTACRRACEGVEFVLHEAALGSVPRSIEDPGLSNECNVTGTLNLLVAAREAGVRRFVFAASSSAYGDTPTLPKVEDMVPQPLSPYALTKLAGEEYCRLFFELYGLETVSLRYFNVFGKRQDPFSTYAAVIPKFVSALLKGEPPEIYGDGEQTRDFTYIADVVQANLRACEASREACGKVYNVAYGERISLNDLYREIAGLLGCDLEPRYGPPRPGDVKHSLADISRARELLGYEPAYDVRRGLAEAIAWYRENLG